MPIKQEYERRTAYKWDKNAEGEVRDRQEIFVMGYYAGIGETREPVSLEGFAIRADEKEAYVPYAVAHVAAERAVKELSEFEGIGDLARLVQEAFSATLWVFSQRDGVMLDGFQRDYLIKANK